MMPAGQKTLCIKENSDNDVNPRFNMFAAHVVYTERQFRL